MRKILITFIVIILLSTFLLFSPIFKLKKGNIEKNNCVGGDFLENTSLISKNIFLVSKEKIKITVKNKYPCVADLEIYKVYPSTIKVKVFVNKPILKIEGTDLFLSENNLVIKFNGGDIIPVLFPPQGINFSEGQKITDKTILFIISLVADVQKSDFIISNIRIVERGSIALYSRDESVALFTQTKDAKMQVDSLQAILAKAKIDSSKIEKIDLRFDKPILVLKQ